MSASGAATSASMSIFSAIFYLVNLKSWSRLRHDNRQKNRFNVMKMDVSKK